MSWIERLARWLSPCAHEWEKIDTLKAKDGSAATLVQACKLCGETKQTTFRAPKSDRACPPHRWKTVKTISLYNGGRPSDGRIPDGFEDVMECQLCGDRKVLRR